MSIEEFVVRALLDDLNNDVDTAAADADDDPTDAEKESGNYEKGHVKLHGLTIAIENSKGSTRSGKDKDGNEWSVTMPAHYGYLNGTKGKDKDHIDVYIGPDAENTQVFVVNQNKKEGGFDEHKAMLGFSSQDDAIKTYDKAFNDGLGPKLRDSVVQVSLEDFKEWLDNGEHTKPFPKD